MTLIAMMRNKMVSQDKTIDDVFVAEGVSLASMLPGPVAVNVVAYTGFHLAGVTGALVSMMAVLLPSFLLVLVLTLLFIQAGDAIAFGSILLGVFPMVAGIILSTGLSMGKKICAKMMHYVIAFSAFVLLLLFKSYLSILLAMGLSAIAGIFLFTNEQKSISTKVSSSWKTVLLSIVVYALVVATLIFITSDTVLGQILKHFTSASLTLFGGGYVMVPILKSTLVDQLGWFTQEEFVYGISVGQVTPGPILISSVFFGYKMAGIIGSLIATISIFFPSAMLMLLLSNIFSSIRNNPTVQAALEGIKPAVVGMILYSAFSIFIEQLDNSNLYVSVTLTAVSFWLVYRFNTANALLILAGGILGLLVY